MRRFLHRGATFTISAARARAVIPTADGGQSLLPRYLEGVERAAAPEAGTGR